MICPTCQVKLKNTRYKVKDPYVPKKPHCSKIFHGQAKKTKKKKKRKARKGRKNFLKRS